MELEEWKRKIKECNKTHKTTMNIYLKENLTLLRRGEDLLIIKSFRKCPVCNTTQKRELKIKTHTKLSIFDVSLLFSVFVLDKLPKDYANYHTTPAGKKFIKGLITVSTYTHKKH